MHSKVFTILTLSALLSLTTAQQAYAVAPEVHPQLLTKQCKNAKVKGEGPICTSIKTSVVFDANGRDLLLADKQTSCLNSTDGGFNTSICSTPASCARKCGWSSVDYDSRGIHTDLTDNSITLNLLTNNKNESHNSPRVYMLSENKDKYQMFQLKNQEFTYDVDVSMLPCGANGALYFIAMPEDGGVKGIKGNNTAGAKFGTGYCDAQCSLWEKFVNGLANFKNETTGKVTTASCCGEMDIQEANSISTAYTPHTCTGPAQSTFPGNSDAINSTGVCDKSGCSFNNYRLGNTSFYGPGSKFTIDTTKPFTVTTQFITNDNTANGSLVDIRRIYKQNGKTIQNSEAEIQGIDEGLNSITDHFCAQQSDVFKEMNGLKARGNMKAFGDNLDFGMVLSMSMWDSEGDGMNWLDSAIPTSSNKTSDPGVLRGSCSLTEGIASNLRKKFPDTKVKFWNMKWGDIGSTL